MRRRRRSTGRWFPTLGTTWNTESQSYHDAGFSFTLDQVPLDKASGPSMLYLPVTKDYTQESGSNLSQDASLRDFVEGQDYILKRMVGKVFLRAHSTAQNGVEANVWPQMQVSAGFMVARADDEDQGAVSLALNEIDLTDANNIMDPWIWRRTWMLRNPSIYQFNASSSSAPFTGDYPVSNAGYGSVLDGPHIDSKSKRRIGREERLWFVVQCQGEAGEIQKMNGLDTAQPYVYGKLDLRIYGQMRKGRNRGNF